jgi:hypothetical protein
VEASLVNVSKSREQLQREQHEEFAEQQQLAPNTTVMKYYTPQEDQDLLHRSDRQRKKPKAKRSAQRPLRLSPLVSRQKQTPGAKARL